jgi:ABC-type Co2+ transport system permease subunit
MLFANEKTVLMNIYVVVSIICELVLPSGQTLTLGPQATITLEVVPFCTYARFCHFLNAFWKSRSVSMFSTACDSASVTSLVSKWWPLSFVFNRENREKWQGVKSGE